MLLPMNTMMWLCTFYGMMQYIDDVCTFGCLSYQICFRQIQNGWILALIFANLEVDRYFGQPHFQGLYNYKAINVPDMMHSITPIWSFSKDVLQCSHGLLNPAAFPDKPNEYNSTTRLRTCDSGEVVRHPPLMFSIPVMIVFEVLFPFCEAIQLECSQRVKVIE